MLSGGCSKIKNFGNILKDDLEAMNETKGLNYNVDSSELKPEF